MDNYDFCASFAAERGGRVLDYGCGDGQIVGRLRGRGVEAFGCDVFYEGGTHADRRSPFVVEMKDRIPFPDAHFDVVVSNQVMEHVADLDAVLAEIARVLKPGGTFLCLFPDKAVWREAHCGVPFLHWFPKGSAARVYYALAFRALGFGHYTEGKTRLQWSRDFCEWLDRWTHYRSYGELRRAWERHFSAPLHIEDRWLDSRRRLPLPNALKTAIVRKLGGLVFVCRKHHEVAAVNLM